jgi:hypothetical protein
VTMYGQCPHCNGVLTAGHKCPEFDYRSSLHAANIALTVVNNEKAFRELRLWHWKQALQCARTLRSKLGNKSSKTRWRNAWKLHMGAVQLLNDLVSGTAEEDCNKQQEKLK